MSNLQVLIREREAIDAKIKELQFETRNALVNTIKKQMAEHGISFSELGYREPGSRIGRPPGAKSKKPVQQRYRDPETGATWSGRGLPPRWLANRDRSDFLINPPGPKHD